MGEKKSKPATIEEYFAQFPEEVQPILVKIRSVIKAAAPQAEEKMTYDMPGYYLNGFLLSFAVWKHHIGFYPRTPAMDALEGLSIYKGTKGSVHFSLKQPMPYDLISQMVKIRVAENLKK